MTTPVTPAETRAVAVPPAATPAVSLRGLTKEFGGTRVVDGIDLDVAAGEFFSLLGPSGCGKTTTLRMIAGFNDPTSGTVLVGGEDVTSTPPHKRDVNTVFQSYALFEHLDVRGNVGFGLRRKGVDRSSIDQRVSEMLELVELGPRAKDRPAQLSGGQRQRVALARALINRPKVLLLDEPLAALDLKLRRAMQVELKTIQREVGITFLFVTHDQDEALSMSDRVAIMNDGVIEQCGTPEDVYENPTSVFAAELHRHQQPDAGHVRRRRGPGRARAGGPGARPHGVGRRRPAERGDPAGEDLDERLRAVDGAGAGHDRVHQLPRRDHAVPGLGGRRHHPDRARAEPPPDARRRPLEPRRPGADRLAPRARRRAAMNATP